MVRKFDGISELAGRFVDTLSRRRVVHWLGGGAFAAITAVPRSGCAEKGNDCVSTAWNYPSPPQPGPRTHKVNVCVSANQCVKTSGFPTEIVCTEQQGGEKCKQNNDCPDQGIESGVCTATTDLKDKTAKYTVVANVVAGAAALKCKPGFVSCEYTVTIAIGDHIACGCDCSKSKISTPKDFGR